MVFLLNASGQLRAHDFVYEVRIVLPLVYCFTLISTELHLPFHFTGCKAPLQFFTTSLLFLLSISSYHHQTFSICCSCPFQVDHHCIEQHMAPKQIFLGLDGLVLFYFHPTFCFLTFNQVFAMQCHDQLVS